MKKVVLKLDVHDNGAKRKALKAVTSLPGIDSISIDMIEKKMTVIGNVDPISIVTKLRKHWLADILTIGPAKEEKKDEPKKDEGKKEDEKKTKDQAQLVNDLWSHYSYYPYANQYPVYYPYPTYVLCREENPNTCTIC